MLNNTGSRLDGMRILVVEDMLLVANEIEHQLRDNGCAVVGPFNRVDAARTAIDRFPLDGALVDVNLGGESGLDVAKVLRRCSIPFIFMTGYEKSYLPEEFRSSPTIQKPFTSRELQGLMEKTFLQPVGKK